MTRAASARAVRHLGLMAVVGAGVVLWALWIGLRPLSDNSFLTHLATGRSIADGDLHRTDPFTFTAAGEPWVVQSWLVAAVYGVLDEVWGGQAIVVLQGALTACLGLLVVRLARPADSVTGRLAVAALAVGVGAGMWVERPLLVGLVLTGLTLLVAQGSLPAPTLLPAMWVWANSHGSFPLGLVLLAALAGGRRLDGEHPGRELVALGWASAGVLAAVVNPLGPRLLAFPLELLQRADVLRNIVEWQAPSFTGWTERLFLVQVAVAMLALVRRPSFRRALPAVLFVAAALVAARNVAVASLVLVPVTAEGLRGLGSIRGDRRAPAFSVAAIALAALGASLLAQAGSEPAFRLDSYPRAALSWFGGAEALERTRTAAPDFVGNYLEAVLGPREVVFVDDRYDMLPDGVIDDYVSLLRARPDWAEVLDRHEIGAVVWERDAALSSVMRASSSWRIAYADARWVVALRRSA